MKEKRYLKWYNMVGYGSGDIAGNVVYALLSSFVMIYLTDTIGLNSGIVGTLIAVSKLLDGSVYRILGKCTVDGAMYSCTSLGVKLGGGLGTAIAGWLLEFGGYVGGAAI